MGAEALSEATDTKPLTDFDRKLLIKLMMQELPADLRALAVAMRASGLKAETGRLALIAVLYFVSHPIGAVSP